MKRMTNISKIIMILVLGLGLSSCYKENFKDHAGPSICPSDDFKYSVQPSINEASINLNTDTLKVRAEFNEEISWTVTIKGLTSKSYKKFSGYDNEISVDWFGNPDTLAFFQAEACEVEVKIACLTESIIIPFTITNLNNFSKLNYLAYNGDAGAVGTGPFTYGLDATHGIVADMASPQGGNCFCTEGLSSSPVWFFGGFDLNVSGVGVSYELSEAVKSNPEEVYFNCFINVKGSTGSIPVVNFTEGTTMRSEYLFISGDSDWHYVSFKLSDADILNPKNITKVSFGLNAYPERGTSGAMCVDFINFTNDKPFISTPSN